MNEPWVAPWVLGAHLNPFQVVIPSAPSIWSFFPLFPAPTALIKKTIILKPQLQSGWVGVGVRKCAREGTVKTGSEKGKA